jgi:hypothetical protein
MGGVHEEATQRLVAPKRVGRHRSRNHRLRASQNRVADRGRAAYRPSIRYQAGRRPSLSLLYSLACALAIILIRYA